MSVAAPTSKVGPFGPLRHGAGDLTISTCQMYFLLPLSIIQFDLRGKQNPGHRDEEADSGPTPSWRAAASGPTLAPAM